MNSNQILPVASALVIIIFAYLVVQRYLRRGGAHLMVWGVGLAMFGVGSFAEAYSAVAWNPTIFRLWYLGGAILNAAWLGQGTVYLLSGQRLPNLLVSLILGYVAAAVLFITLAAPLALDRRIVATLISFHGLIFGAAFYRRLVRRWPPSRVTAALTGLLVAGSLVATYLIFIVPLDATRFSPDQTLSAQYREILPPGATVRRLTPIFNIYGLIALVGGALYSAFLLWRKEIAPNRVVGNILIATGALALGFASTLVRLGLADYLYLAELAAAILMFAGFLLATTKAPAMRPERVEGKGI
ncbi:MAG: hypothetical protein ACRDF5_11395 [bacterium]